MAEITILLSIVLIFLTFWLYGLKWAVLIAITVVLCSIFLFLSNTRGNVSKNRQDTSNMSEDVSDRSDTDVNGSFYTTNARTAVESTGYRLVKNIARRNPSLTQDAQMTRGHKPLYKSRSATRRNISTLRSPEPLLSQVTRHLSFNNTSYYYPEKTKLNGSFIENSMLYASIHPKWNTQSATRQPMQSQPSLDKTSNFTEEEYIPRQSSIIFSPLINGPHNTSTVKISRPGEDVSCFTLESILQKRLERTGDNPCSRQSVLSALGQKSRKRSAYDSDGSMGELYSVKKRKRDDVDDFLDALGNPSPWSSYAGANTVKRSYSDSVPEQPTSVMSGKRPKENDTQSHGGSSPPLGNSTVNTFEDSGVDLNSPFRVSQENIPTQAKVVAPPTSRKRKSVTFSDKLVNECENDVEVEIVNTEGGNSQDANSSNKPKDSLPIFRIDFSPRRSLAPGNLSVLSDRIKSKKSPPRHRASKITWKDVQDNRREAWRRSQKVLDEIEECFAKKAGPMSSLDVTSTSTTAVTSLLVSTVTSLPLSTMVSSNQESGQAQHGNVTSQIPNLSKSTAERPGHPLPNTAIGSNTIFSPNPPLNLSQSGNFTGSSDIKAASTIIVAKSLSDPPPITGLFGGTAVSLFASSSSSGNTSSKTSASNQQAVGPKGTAPQPIPSSGPGFAFQPLAPGVSTGNTTQTTTSIGLNVRSGVLNTGVKGSSMIQSTAQTSQITDSVASITNANTAGVAVDASFREKSTPSSGVPFSATSSAIPANLTGGFTVNMQQTVAPAVKTNDVSSGFQFRTASTDKSSAASSAFTFATPLAEKTNSGSGAFTFNTQAPQKTAFQNVSSMANPTSTTAGFQFAVPASNVPAASYANFQFSGAGKTNSSNGGLQFNAASTGKIGVSNDSARAADKLGGGVFTFAPPATNQSTNGTSGSQFSSPAAGKPSGIGVFQFNSTPAAAHKPSTSGGFQFTAPTARNENSNAEGFKLNAPAINNPSGGVGFTFPAAKSEKPNFVGTGFQFTAPATSNMVSSFNFNNAVSSANTTQSGGFVFNPTLPLSNNNVGFNFAAQDTPANFNFGSPPNSGGFNFAAGFASATPVSGNSGRTSSNVARTRQRRGRNKK